MRYLILIASLLLAANALADKKPASAAKELDKSSPQLQSADSPDADRHKQNVVHRDIASRKAEARDFGLSRATEASEGKVRAQDYNSSRSNTTAAREKPEGDLDGDGRPDVVACRDGVDEDCDDGDVEAVPANHNTTRSNRLTPKDGNDTVVRKKPGKH